jgi:hypothetical protein
MTHVIALEGGLYDGRRPELLPEFPLLNQFLVGRDHDGEFGVGPVEGNPPPPYPAGIELYERTDRVADGAPIYSIAERSAATA